MNFFGVVYWNECVLVSSVCRKGTKIQRDMIHVCTFIPKTFNTIWCHNALRFSLSIHHYSMFAMFIKIQILYMGSSQQLCPDIILFTCYTCRRYVCVCLIYLIIMFVCFSLFVVFLNRAKARCLWAHNVFITVFLVHRVNGTQRASYIVFISVSAFIPSTSMILRFSFAVYTMILPLFSRIQIFRLFLCYPCCMLHGIFS